MPEPDPYLSWLSFICCSCGEQTYIGVPDDQEQEQTALMLFVLFGDPPRCTGCQQDTLSVLPLNRSQRRRLRRRGYCQPQAGRSGR